MIALICRTCYAEPGEVRINLAALVGRAVPRNQAIQSIHQSLALCGTVNQFFEQTVQFRPGDFLIFVSLEKSLSRLVGFAGSSKVPDDWSRLVGEFVRNIHKPSKRVRNLRSLHSFFERTLGIWFDANESEYQNFECHLMYVCDGQRCRYKCSSVLSAPLSVKALVVLPSSNCHGSKNCQNTPDCLGPRGHVHRLRLGCASPRKEQGPSCKYPKSESKDEKNRHIPYRNFLSGHRYYLVERVGMIRLPATSGDYQ